MPATLGYGLFNPKSGSLIMFDHRQLATGMMIEAKGHYEGVLKFDAGRKSVRREFLDQAERQIEAADADGGRPIEWHFYEKATMAFAKELFRRRGFLKRITLVYTPYPGDAEWPYPKDARRTWARGRQTP